MNYDGELQRSPPMRDMSIIEEVYYSRGRVIKKYKQREPASTLQQLKIYHNVAIDIV